MHDRNYGVILSEAKDLNRSLVRAGVLVEILRASFSDALRMTFD